MHSIAVYNAQKHRTKGRNRKFNDSNWKLQFPLSVMDIATRQKNNKKLEDE